MSDDIEDKYLDPEQNPFIVPAEEKTEALKPGDAGFDDAILAPMVNYDLTAETLTEKIAAVYPAESEIKISDALTIVKMVAGNYTVKGSGKTLEELAFSDLMMINDFLVARLRLKG